MLTPPDDLPQDVLALALARGWQVAAASMSYRTVGFGSHHWEVTDAAGARWFLTADELENKRASLGEPLPAAFGRLRASLAAAADLRDYGCRFVVAPVRARAGEPLVRVNDRFGVALYPFVDGESFEWGEFSTPAHRRGALDCIVALHMSAPAAARQARADDFAIPHRDELQAAISRADFPECGPYARPAALLLASSAVPVRRLLARYDELVRPSRCQPAGMVLTHGEPHPGNTMLAAGEWLLVDWDTALVAPPERDLWSLDSGDGAVLAAYAEATGVTPRPVLLELYRIRWDLADIAATVSCFRRPHCGSMNSDESWDVLRSLVERISS